MTASDQMSLTIRRRLLALGTAAATTSLLGARTAFAQPGGVRRIIVGFPAGGFTDRLARMFAEALGAASSSNFVVENRAGAGGMIATEAVVRAEGDGRVLLFHNVDSLALERALGTDQGLDPFRSLTILAPVARVDFLVVANAALGLRGLQDLIALARRSTTGVSYVDTGPVARLTFEFLSKKFGLNLLGVPYRGLAPAMVDLLAGRVDLATLDGGAAAPLVAAGKLTILGRTDAIRPREKSGIPPLAEQGADGLTLGTRFALMAPASISPAIAESLRSLATGVLKEPPLRAQLEQAGFHPIDEPPDAFARAVAESVNHYRRLAQQAGMTT